MLDRNALLTVLKDRIGKLGLTVVDETADGFRAEQQNILVKWFLGQRKVIYRMAVKLSEPAHEANFREMVKESSWGLLPPTITVQTTSLRGVERSGTHAEYSPAGGGKVDFAAVREDLKKLIADAGWTFHLEALRAP